MNSIIKKIIVISLILSGITLYGYGDYYWGENRLKKSDLTPVYVRHDWTLLKPWSWFKQPVVEIMWVDRYVCAFEPYCYVWYIHEKRGEEMDKGVLIANIETNRFIITSESELKEVVVTEYEEHFNWFDADGASGGLINYLKSQPK